ncbi:uncharacterized protein [Paramisgurnus dabryanus]|uniref:uncharacterized protein n=1 Tax=Paramisgurnus dabryanus TaxID=90735 RepID=UPI003CCF1151
MAALPRVTVRVTPDRSVFTGETVTLKCEIEDQYRSLNWTYLWYKKRTSERYTVNRDSLTITRVTESDQDDYWCSAERQGQPQTSQTSSSVDFIVKALPRATVRVTPDRSVFTGETVTLKCEIEDQYRSLNWRYLWYKDTTEVLNSEHYTVNRDSLTITGVTESDQKEFSCSAEIHGRPQTQSRSDVHLTVKAAGSSSLGLIVGLCLGLSVMFLIFFLVLLWCYKNKKLSRSSSAVSQQQNISQTSDQKQTEDGYISLQTVTQADPSNAVYSQINFKIKKLKSKENESESADLTYADIELKPKREINTRKKGIKSESEDTVYSKLKKGRD